MLSQAKGVKLCASPPLRSRATSRSVYRETLNFHSQLSTVDDHSTTPLLHHFVIFLAVDSPLLISDGSAMFPDKFVSLLVACTLAGAVTSCSSAGTPPPEPAISGDPQP